MTNTWLPDDPALLPASALLPSSPLFSYVLSFHLSNTPTSAPAALLLKHRLYAAHVFNLFFIKSSASVLLYLHPIMTN